jgi:CheY-like chemotaxis protein
MTGYVLCVITRAYDRFVDSRSVGPSPFKSESAAPVKRPLRILVADDDRDTVLTLLMLLRHEGYDVRGVYNGNDVLKISRELQPDVIILDITMPRMSGYELARTLRARYGDSCPVLIAVTAWDKTSDRLLSELLGFNHHFGKPLDPQALMKLLATLSPK